MSEHVTLTNRQLYEAAAGLRDIGPKAIKNIRAAFGIAVIKRVAQTALTDLEEARKKLVADWATKEQNGGKPLTLTDGTVIPDIEGFNADFQKLLDISITLDCKPLHLADLDGTEGFSADDLFALGPFVVT
jgi:hypothetical protein